MKKRINKNKGRRKRPGSVADEAVMKDAIRMALTGPAGLFFGLLGAMSQVMPPDPDTPQIEDIQELIEDPDNPGTFIHSPKK